MAAVVYYVGGGNGCGEQMPRSLVEVGMLSDLGLLLIEQLEAQR